MKSQRTVTLRIRVFLTRRSLDRLIADGTRYEASEALALRVSQLTDAGYRRRIAGGLRGVVAYVDDRESGRLMSSVVIEPAAVRAGREAILGLAERLEADARFSARGIVLADALLTDGLSPLYNPFCERTVTDAVFDVQDALGAGPAIGFDAIAA